MAQKEGGWTVVKDPTGAMGPYAYKGDQWVGYDDPDIIALKVIIMLTYVYQPPYKISYHFMSQCKSKIERMP